MLDNMGIERPHYGYFARAKVILFLFMKNFVRIYYMYYFIFRFMKQIVQHHLRKKEKFIQMLRHIYLMIIQNHRQNMVLVSISLNKSETVLKRNNNHNSKNTKSFQKKNCRAL